MNNQRICLLSAALPIPSPKTDHPFLKIQIYPIQMHLMHQNIITSFTPPSHPILSHPIHINTTLPPRRNFHRPFITPLRPIPQPNLHRNFNANVASRQCPCTQYTSYQRVHCGMLIPHSQCCLPICLRRGEPRAEGESKTEWNDGARCVSPRGV